MKTLIKLRQATLGYGRRVILDSIDFQLEQGQFWFVVGPNGQGKSTLVKTVMGLLPPRRGESWRDEALAGLAHTGFVPQRCDFNPTLPTTVEEFIRLGLVGLRLTRADEADRLAWALDRVGLAALRHQDFSALSGGQRQRSLLARALVRRPSLLILDEPTNGLDLNTEEALLAALQRLNREDHLTILFVTHDLPLALRFATHLAVVHGGRVEQGERTGAWAAGALARAYGVDLSWLGNVAHPEAVR